MVNQPTPAPRGLIPLAERRALHVQYLQGTCHAAFAANIRTPHPMLVAHEHYADFINSYGDKLAAALEAHEDAAS